MQTLLVNGDDSAEAIARDVAAVGRIDAVPSLLRVICQSTGMRFAAVARVTAGTWTACAVQDEINFGLKPGGQLKLDTTLCMESRTAREPIVIDHASENVQYRDHHTPRIYGIESYISVPIIMRNGDYFGNLCAIDPAPAQLENERTINMFKLFAELVAVQLENDERHQATQAELEDQRTEAELREQFIAVLGHDLRNPLSTAGVLAELLARRHAEPEISKIGQQLRAVARRMAGLIDDVIDLARARMGGGMAMAPASTADLGRALTEVVAELQVANPGRNFIASIAIDRPVLCDVARVQQLLSNLLGNAVSHGAADQVVVVDAVVAGDALEIAVTNSGTPIAPENLQRIFEPYWRPASSQAKGGLGLGLYICDQIARAHGGTLTATSSVAAGTRFVARLPLG